MLQSKRPKLQKPAPMDLDPVSHEPSPAVHAPWNSNAPRRPDSVPQWHSRFVFYPTFEDLFWLLDPNVSCSPPSFNLGSSTFILDVFLDVEKVVEVVVWLFIGTQKRLVSLHSALDGSRREGHTARAV